MYTLFVFTHNTSAAAVSKVKFTETVLHHLNQQFAEKTAGVWGCFCYLLPPPLCVLIKSIHDCLCNSKRVSWTELFCKKQSILFPSHPPEKTITIKHPIQVLAKRRTGEKKVKFKISPVLSELCKQQQHSDRQDSWEDTTEKQTKQKAKSNHWYDAKIWRDK